MIGEKERRKGEELTGGKGEMKMREGERREK